MFHSRQQATGIERFELIGKAEGVDVFDMAPLDASRTGTLDNPIEVFSYVRHCPDFIRQPSGKVAKWLEVFCADYYNSTPSATSAALARPPTRTRPSGSTLPRSSRTTAAPSAARVSPSLSLCTFGDR